MQLNTNCHTSPSTNYKGTRRKICIAVSVSTTNINSWIKQFIFLISIGNNIPSFVPITQLESYINNVKNSNSCLFKVLDLITACRIVATS